MVTVSIPVNQGRGWKGERVEGREGGRVEGSEKTAIGSSERGRTRTFVPGH